LFVYQYAYRKGYTEGGTNFIEASIKALNKKESTATNISDYSGLYSVVHITDGDTIDIEKEGTKVRVRLLGMNSPESVDPRRPTECYGKEAKNYMIELLQDKKVRLQLDALKPERDEYGRVLAYIWREDGLFVNQDMIERGYAYEYTYKQEKYKFQENFKSTQGKAKERAVGLWAQSTCNGKK
jgi:micrococcal nuclease